MTKNVQDDDMVDAVINLNVETEMDTTTDDVESDPTTNLGSAQVKLEAIARVKCFLKAQNRDFDDGVFNYLRRLQKEVRMT